MVTKTSRRWSIGASIILFFISLQAILPFILLIIISFSSEQSVHDKGYSFFPDSFSMEAYRYIAGTIGNFGRYIGISALVTLIGTVLCVLITAMLAYTLSQPKLPGVKFLNIMVVITMLFNAGLAPTYIIYTKYLHITNTLAAYIFPNLLLNGFMVMIVRNYFTHNVPKEIYEAAQVDGTNTLQCFAIISLPLSKPILATIGLLSAIGYWNDWQNGLYYIKNDKLLSIQTYLNKVNEGISFLSSNATMGAGQAELPTATIRMAIAVVAIAPIVLLYPFFHKYFERGIMLGSVKG